MIYQTIILEINNKNALITINRPDKLNALNAIVMSELRDCLMELKKNENVSVIILTGSGQKAFVAGADISELSNLDMISAKEFSEKGQGIFNLIENFNKPVIAAVNGFALGGGCELALACHMRLASENAKFGQPEINLGLIPGYGGTQRLTRLINSGRSLELILTGDLIDAAEAYRLGIVNKVFPIEELMNKTYQLAFNIASKGQYAIRQAIKAVNMSNEVSRREGLNFETSLFSLCCGTDDFKEGTSAFLAKRKPVFKNKY
ncbi:MAG: enoyl-CoA hydratase-related protein [Ignavibacteriaceae bacterium]|nr:enoyl-CoA hydratase-related protein [Ignavibacteriaceae bacterium]